MDSEVLDYAIQKKKKIVHPSGENFVHDNVGWTHSSNTRFNFPLHSQSGHVDNIIFLTIDIDFVTFGQLAFQWADSCDTKVMVLCDEIQEVSLVNIGLNRLRTILALQLLVLTASIP